MSLNLYVDALDLGSFRAVQGSRDEGLLARILEKAGPRLQSIDAYLGRIAPGGSYLPLGETIARIVRGEVSGASPVRFEYEVAAGVIADTLGQPLDAEALSEARAQLWDETDATIREAVRAAAASPESWPTIEAVLERGPLLDLPLDPRLRLGTGYLDAAEVRAALAVAERADGPAAAAAAEVQWPEAVEEAVLAYREWLKAAAQLNVGLFLHQ